MSMQKIKKEPKVSAPNVNVSPGVQLDAALTSIGTQIDLKADIAAVDAVTGSRSNLNTTDKTNLVAAINELNNKVNADNDYNDLTNKPIEKTTDNGYRITGSQTVASAANAFAEGNESKATAASAHAEGTQTEATQTSAHAEGQGSWAWGESSHAEGQETWAYGFASHAEGYISVAHGLGSHAEGRSEWMNIGISRAYTAGDRTMYVKAEVEPGHVITDDVQIIGVLSCTYQELEQDYSLTLDSSFNADFAADEVLAESCSAYGAYSHTEGNLTTAKGAASHAEGGGTNANGSSSHAEGEESVADGAYTHAEGYYTYAQNDAEHASGKYNVSTPNVTQFSVGIGTDDLHRANAFEIGTNGNVYINGVGGYDGKSIANVDSLQTVITDVNTGLAALTTKLNAFGRAGTRCSEQLLALGNSYAFDYTNPYGFYDHGWVPSKNVNSVAIGNSVSSIGSCSFATGLGSTGGNRTSYFYELARAYTSGDTYIYLKEKPIGGFILTKNSSYDTPVTEDVCKIQSVEYENGDWKVYLVYPYINKDIAANGYVYPVTGTHGDYSSCFGSYTVAQGENSTVVGTCNYPSASDIFSVGVGLGLNAVSRSNAVLVTQSGDVYIKGIGNYDGGDYTSAGVKSIQTVISELQDALI